MRHALTCSGVLLLAVAGCGRDTLVGETTYDAAVTTVHGAEVAWEHAKDAEPLPRQRPPMGRGVYVPGEDPPWWVRRIVPRDMDEGFAAAVRTLDSPDFRLAR